VLTKIVFLETNALYSLGPRLENVDFATLQAFCKLLNVDLLVAETSWQEYLRHRKKELSDCLSRNKQNHSMLEKHSQTVELVDKTHEQISESLRTLNERNGQMAQAIGLKVVPVPPMDVRVLLDMSLASEPPFEYLQNDSGEKTKEKGFRDAAIMFTMLDAVGMTC